MTYQIHPLLIDDVREVFTMAQSAFAKTNRHLYNPYPASAESFEKILERQAAFIRDRRPNQTFKAVDDATGQIVAAAGWSVYEEDEPVTKTVEETVEARMQPRVPELCEETFRGVYTVMTEGRRDAIGSGGEGEAGERKVVKCKKRVELEFLYTHPGFQRRGIASALLRRFLQETEGLGLMLYLQATDEGKPLYERIGFETVLERRYLFEGGEPYNMSVCVFPPPFFFFLLD